MLKTLLLNIAEVQSKGRTSIKGWTGTGTLQCPNNLVHDALFCSRHLKSGIYLSKVGTHVGYDIWLFFPTF